MMREDALALLDTFRLDCDEAPPPDPDRLSRRFVRIVCPDRLAYERGPDRAERDQ